MKKKLMCLLLVLILVLSCVPTALAADAPKPQQGDEIRYQPQDSGMLTREKYIKGYEKWRTWWKIWKGETVTYHEQDGWRYYVDGDTAIITAYLGNATDVTTPPVLGGKNVTAIGTAAFSMIENLNSVTISEGVIQLGDIEFEGEDGTFLVGYVFDNCSSLTRVNLPSTLATLGRGNFDWCVSLGTFTVPEINSNFCIIDDVLFSVTDDDMIMECYPAAKEGTDYEVPSGVIRIVQRAMLMNQYLENLVIPNTVEIDRGGIENLPNLKTVTVEAGAASIGGFGGCWQLETVVLPDTIKVIGEEAFSSCQNITSIDLPDQLEIIEQNAFSYSGLEDLHIPASVREIGSGAFTSCEELLEITVDGSNAYYEADADGVLFTKDKETLLLYPPGKSGSHYSVPEGVTTISSGAFDSAMLTSIELPDSLEIIEGRAFNECQITTIHLPEYVHQVDANAFYGCFDLQSITVDGDNDEFKDDEVALFTKDGFDLVAYPIGNSDPYTVPDGVERIRPGAFASAALSVVTLPDSLLEIGWDAFASSSLTGITIPKNVASIGECAFAYSSLESVTFAEPAFVDEIGYGAFMGTPLTSVSIPSSVTIIGEDAFAWCEQLAYIDVDAANENYKSENGVLFTDDGKTLLQFPPAKGMSGYRASSAEKSYAKASASYTIPNAVENISSSSFASCGLTSITIPASVHTIESNAFANNKDLSKVIVYSDDVAYSEVERIDSLNAALSELVFSNSPGVVLCGHVGSTTQAYATRFDLPFSLIPTALSLNKPSETLTLGATAKLTATTTPSGADVSWSSSKPSVVSVDSNGNLTANTVGTAIITASSFDQSATCTVTVVQPEPPVVEAPAPPAPAPPVVEAPTPPAPAPPPHVGTFAAKKIPAKAFAGTAITIAPPVAPKGHTMQSVSYSSSNPSIATVDANGNVTFVGGGKATIIIKAVSQTVDKRGRVKTKTTTVKKNITVNQVVESISLNLTDTTIARTQKVKLTTAFAPATASNKKVKWTTSNKKVATVSSAGVVTGKAGGTAVITCRAQDGSGASASCSVTVTPINPTGLKLSKSALTVKTGKTSSLKATVAPKNTDFKTVTWTSSNPAIVSVDAKGKLKGIAPGTVTITATTSNGLSASCTVTVQ